MMFTPSIVWALAFIPSIIAAPTPSGNSIVLNIGGEDVTISSSGPVSVVSGGTASNSNPAPVSVASSTTVTNAKAVYFISNDKKNNAVIAMKVGVNGQLSHASSTLTGGSGSNGIDQTAGGPAAPDALFSQGAVKVAGNVSLAPFNFTLL